MKSSEPIRAASKAPAMYESANGGDVREFDTSSSLALKRYLADIDGLAGVFSSTNTWGPTAARLAEELGLPTQSSRMLERLADKHWVRSRLFRAGLDPR